MVIPIIDRIYDEYIVERNAISSISKSILHKKAALLHESVLDLKDKRNLAGSKGILHL